MDSQELHLNAIASEIDLIECSLILEPFSISNEMSWDRKVILVIESLLIEVIQRTEDYVQVISLSSKSIDLTPIPEDRRKKIKRITFD